MDLSCFFVTPLERNLTELMVASFLGILTHGQPCPNIEKGAGSVLGTMSKESAT